MVLAITSARFVVMDWMLMDQILMDRMLEDRMTEFTRALEMALRTASAMVSATSWHLRIFLRQIET